MWLDQLLLEYGIDRLGFSLWIVGITWFTMGYVLGTYGLRPFWSALVVLFILGGITMASLFSGR